MFEFVHMGAIIGTSLFMMAIESIWFSPIFFGKIKKTDNSPERYNFLLIFLQLGAYMLLFFTFAHILILLPQISVSLWWGSLGIAAILVGVDSVRLIREKVSFGTFFASASFLAFLAIGGLHMLQYWPW